MSSLFPEENQELPTKKCIYCKEYKCLIEFGKHSHHKDRLDSRCKHCIKKQTNIRKVLFKNAPEKPKNCECCKKETNDLVLDHDHKTNKFRGWICNACNVGIGKLGDDIEGVQSAIIYLQKIING
jgi:uncharacterized ferredoxin-like protein